MAGSSLAQAAPLCQLDVGQIRRSSKGESVNVLRLWIKPERVEMSPRAELPWLSVLQTPLVLPGWACPSGWALVSFGIRGFLGSFAENAAADLGCRFDDFSSPIFPLALDDPVLLCPELSLQFVVVVVVVVEPSLQSDFCSQASSSALQSSSLLAQVAGCSTPA